MIILHSNKLILFRVPKTGSTAMQYNIKQSEAYDEETDVIAPEVADATVQRVHTTPQMAYDAGLITDDMLDTYSMYAVIRNPTDRFMSALGHQVRPARMNPTRIKNRLSMLGVDVLIDIFKMEQKNWFYINDVRVVVPILYDNYQDELETIYSELGVEVGTETKNAGQTRATDDEVFDTDDMVEILATITEYYADDWVLYNYATENDLATRQAYVAE